MGIHPDGEIAVFAGEDGSLRVWNIPQLVELGKIQAHNVIINLSYKLTFCLEFNKFIESFRGWKIPCYIFFPGENGEALGYKETWR